jgi:hypothetical protein
MIKSLRLLVVANVVTMLAQAAFAGRMLGGDYRSANLHELTAKVLVLLGATQVLFVILLSRTGRSPRWMLVSSVGVLGAEILEFALGHLHHVAIHVPLGLAIFGGAIRQALWVLQPKGAEAGKVIARI